MKKFSLISLSVVLVISAVTGFWGCFYEQEDENHPTGPDRTGVQGWALNVSITPSTAPANGDARLNVHCKFMKLEDGSAVPNQNIYLTLYEASGKPAHFMEVQFPNGTNHTMMTTNANGTASIQLEVGYLNRIVNIKEFIVWAETTWDFDNNAQNFWNTHAFRLYNPYYDGDPTPIPPDNSAPVANFTFWPQATTTCETITFDASLSYDLDSLGLPDYDQIVTYNWMFGDGMVGNGKVVKHKFDNDGSYTVELVVYDDEGFPGYYSATVPVAGCNQ